MVPVDVLYALPIPLTLYYIGIKEREFARQLAVDSEQGAHAISYADLSITLRLSNEST